MRYQSTCQRLKSIDTSEHTMQKPILISSFGGLKLATKDGCAGIRHWKSPKVYQLMLAIVALGGRNIPAIDIGDLIWPDIDGDKAMQNLEFMLRRLRQVLKESIDPHLQSQQPVLVHHGKISLNHELIDLDLWHWQALASKAKEQREGQHHNEAFTSETAAAALIKGPFLEGDIAYVGFQQELWHTRIGNWLHSTVDLWHHDPSITDGQLFELMDRGILIDPCSEKLCMQRMNILLETGYRVDALRIHKNWATLIREKLGISPPDIPNNIC